MRWLFFAGGGLFFAVGVFGLAIWLLRPQKRRECVALGQRPVDFVAVIGAGLLMASGGVFHLAWIPLLGVMLLVVTADRQRQRRARLDPEDPPPMFRRLDAGPRNPPRRVLHPAVYRELSHLRRNRQEQPEWRKRHGFP